MSEHGLDQQNQDNKKRIYHRTFSLGELESTSLSYFTLQQENARWTKVLGHWTKSRWFIVHLPKLFHCEARKCQMVEDTWLVGENWVAKSQLGWAERNFFVEKCMSWCGRRAKILAHHPFKCMPQYPIFHAFHTTESR